MSTRAKVLSLLDDVTRRGRMIAGRLHACATKGAAAQNRAGVPNWEQHLRGRVAWAEQLNAAKAQRLRRLLDQVDWAS